jgi:hypothetical protein
MSNFNEYIACYSPGKEALLTLIRARKTIIAATAKERDAEAEGRKACDVAPVSRTAKGIVPESTASLMLRRSAMLWMVTLSRG